MAPQQPQRQIGTAEQQGELMESQREPRQILMAIAFDRTLFITISGKELVL